MAWFYLCIAGIFEVAWAVGLKYSHGLTRLWPTVATFALMAVSFFLLSTAMKSLPLGTAYAVWTGIGAVGTALMGMVLFGEPYAWTRLVCIALIVIGIVGLNLTK